MLILLVIVAFAWLMGANLYVLLYQQYNVALIAYLRNTYPNIHEKTKNRFIFGIFASAQQMRSALERATADEKLDDPTIDQLLTDLAELRKRGIWIFGPLTGLLLLLTVLYFWT